MIKGGFVVHENLPIHLIRLYTTTESVVLQGPAIYVCNNARFTEEDWEGIKMLRKSVKEVDPLKVGRYGLGFKSVFHITGK